MLDLLFSFICWFMYSLFWNQGKCLNSNYQSVVCIHRIANQKPENFETHFEISPFLLSDIHFRGLIINIAFFKFSLQYKNAGGMCRYLTPSSKIIIMYCIAGRPYVVTYVPGSKGGPSFCKLFQFPNFGENQVRYFIYYILDQMKYYQ